MQRPDVLQSMLGAAGVARIEEAQGRPPRLQQIHPKTGQEARALGQRTYNGWDHGGQARTLGQHAYDGWEYYRTPSGHHPRSENYFVFRSIDLLAQFNAFGLIHLILPRPLLVIVGTEAATAYLSQEAVEKAREPKELCWIDGASHVDLYDKEEYVPIVVAKLADLFGAHLGGSKPGDRTQQTPA